MSKLGLSSLLLSLALTTAVRAQSPQPKEERQTPPPAPVQTVEAGIFRTCTMDEVTDPRTLKSIWLVKGLEVYRGPNGKTQTVRNQIIATVKTRKKAFDACTQWLDGGKKFATRHVR